MTATTTKLGADMTDQKTQMREGFEAQRKAGMNVDWFTWQIAWHDALFTVHDIAALARQPAAIDTQGAISVQEAWEAAGGNPGIRATKAELLTALKQLDEVCDAVPSKPAAIGKEAVGQWVHCSPSLLNAGVSCANTPRRACECNPENGGHDHFIAHSAAPLDNEASKHAETHDRLLVALERAATAESALRALVDECENDSVAGWEDRMQQRINHANRLLAAAAPAAPSVEGFRLVPIEPDSYTVSLIPSQTEASAREVYRHMVEVASTRMSPAKVKAWSCSSETNGTGLCKSWCRDPVICPGSLAAPAIEQDEREAFRKWYSTHKVTGDVAEAAWMARAASTSVNVAQAGHTVVPIEPTVAMVDALWDALPKGFTFNNCTPIGVVASIIAAAPSQSANVAQGAEAARQIEQYVLSVLPSVYYMDPPDGGSVSVLEQLRRMADDAAKYRASTAQPELAYGAEALRERIARALHYPACWDTAAYPTLESAVWEAIACAKLGCSKCEPAQPALTDDARDAFIRDVAAQKPEKPDHWSSCGQCGHNIERAQDLLDAAQSASGDTQ